MVSGWTNSNLNKNATECKSFNKTHLFKSNAPF